MTSTERVSERVAASCRTGGGAVAVERAVTEVIGEVVPFDLWCVLTVDPATTLTTGGFHERGLPARHLGRLVEIEAANDDALALPSLARGPARVDTLSNATRGDPTRSTRYRDVFVPSGVRHELRALFTSRAGAWGAMILLRGEDRPDFAPAEVELVERSTRCVATAIRRELLLTEIDNTQDADGPGLVLLDEALRPRSVTAAARRWLGEIEDGLAPRSELPYAVLSLAGRARGGGRAARSRLRARSGRWLTLHGDAHPDGTVSVIVEPTRPTELAELIADAYGLTAREREVARLLATGHSRAELARSMALSPHTVDDHVKRAFAKVGVRSRAELTAKLFFDQHLPRINDEVPIGGTGWYVR